MNTEHEELLAKAALAFGIEVHRSSTSCWLYPGSCDRWNPEYSDRQAFGLMVAMRAELQYLEGKQEVVITSNDGRVSISRPYGAHVPGVTRELIVLLALELSKKVK